MTKPAAKKTRNETLGEKLVHLPGISRLEWLIAGISAAGLGAVIIYLAFIALTGGNGPAQIEVTASGVIARENEYVVEFVAVNRVGRSAAGVEINGRLRDGLNIVEESSVTLDYIPQHSQRRGGLIFRNDPSRYEIEVAAAGYFEP